MHDNKLDPAFPKKGRADGNETSIESNVKVETAVADENAAVTDETAATDESVAAADKNVAVTDENAAVTDETAVTKTHEKKTEKDESCPSIFDKPDYHDEKPVRARRLSRHAKMAVIALIAAIAVALSAGLTLYFIPNDDVVDSSSSEDSAQTEEKYIYDYYAYYTDFADTDTLKLGGVESLSVKNPSDEFSVVPVHTTKTETDELTLEEKEVPAIEWNISAVSGADITGVVFDPSYVGFVAGDVMRIKYSDIYVENAASEIEQGGKTYYEECGLDTPTASVTIKFSDGSSIEACLGDKTPVGNQYYMCVKASPSEKGLQGAPVSDDTVYKIDYEDAAFMLKEAKYYVDGSLFAPPEDETHYNDEGDEVTDEYFSSGTLIGFDGISITGNNFPTEYNFEMCNIETPPNTTIYKMTSPHTQNVDSKKMDALLAVITDDFKAQYCLEYRADAAILSKYGLDKPDFCIDYLIKNKNYQVKVGKVITSGDYEGYYPVILNASPSVYVFSAELLSFITYREKDYASADIYSANIDIISAINFNIGGENIPFYLTHTAGETSDSEKELSVRCINKTVNTEDFRDFYVKFLSVNAIERTDTGKAENPVLKITIAYTDIKQYDELAFYKYSDRRYYCTLNGSGTALVLSTAVDELIEAIRAFQ